MVDVDGFKIGMMTCYDIRFPELGRRLALDGADILVLPAAWIKGPLKEHHWHSLVTVRALENTCYILAVGASGPRNIGLSQVVDPLGITIAGATEQDGLLVATVDRDRIQYARDILPVLENRRFATPALPTDECF
ncbi:nitrilase-related carbon-nitrogen hydrolase [Vibrio sp. PP-XX7]